MKKSMSSVLLVMLVCLEAGENRAASSPSTAVLTYHNDIARTGQNTNETLLTLANVNTNSFGKLFTCAVDGYVYAQPLVLTNVNIPGRGILDVVYVATEHDSVYAFDANSNAGPLWQVSFLNPAAGVAPVSSADLDCTDIVPEIGITSTPVIDPISGTIYVEAKTGESSGNNINFVHRLHALDVTTGAEKFGGPVVITASVTGSGAGSVSGRVAFDSQWQMNRAALLLNHGVVYLGFGSHCDSGPFHGWLLAYNATTLAQIAAFNTTPNGEGGGIWHAGNGPSCDANGNLYVMTGNGTFDASTNKDFGDSVIKLSTAGGLSEANYFTPFNQAFLNTNDLDLGSGGTVVLPDEVGNSAHPQLLVGAGKKGVLYLFDRNNLGKYNGSTDMMVEKLNVLGSNFSTPVYFNFTLYYLGVQGYLTAFPVSNAFIGAASQAQGSTQFGFPGATPSLSANGLNDAIIWVIQSDAYDSNGNAVLRAYNASNLAQELYNSDQAGTRDQPGAAVKFAVPTIANGKVYVGTQYALSVFGSLAPSPVIILSANFSGNG
ncbi:MAG TPA: pyrrolo-quinoline quinone, partial [Verrucomicrobiae bacterium]|nr:pyrrolo-quinoline quinone [Verrucomicrobiae bacterium]